MYQDDKLMMTENLDNNIKYMKLMVEIRNNIINTFIEKENHENNNLYKLASIINWIECYSEEIIYLQIIFSKLSKKIPELFEQIENIINNGVI